MTASTSDERRLIRQQLVLDTAINAKLAAFKTETLETFAAIDRQQTALITSLQAVVTEQAALLAELAKRKQAVPLGNAPPITVGSLVSISTAATKRWVLPLAGVRPTDLLFAQPDEYLPEAYGLPQAICRNAGQIEIRIDTPTLALGVTKTITLAITALR